MKTAGMVVAGVVALLVSGTAAMAAGKPAEEASKTLAGRELTMVENLAAAREAYRKSLEAVVSFYETTGESYKLKLARKELAALNRIPKKDFGTVAEALDEAKATQDIPEANRLLEDAQHYEKLSQGADRKLNRGLALERCLDLMRRFPESDRIDDAAYLAGSIYEQELKDYRKAMVYYEKCYQWNPATTTNARIQAARMALKLRDYTKTRPLYEEALKNSPDPADREKASIRLSILKAMGH